MALAIWITAIVAPIGRDCSAYAADSATSTVPDDNVTFSIPTTIPFAIKADGSTIAPTDWKMSVGSGSPHVKISGFNVTGFPTGVSISGESDTCSTWSHKGTGAVDGKFLFDSTNGGIVQSTGGSDDDPICWAYGPKRLGYNKVDWVLGGISSNRELLNKAVSGRTVIGTVSITVSAVYDQAFAIISDDGQMRFYKRYRIPSIGEEYDGVTVKHVYAGLDGLRVDTVAQKDYWGTTDAPWVGELDEPKSVKIMDDGIAFRSMAYMFQHMTNVKTIDLTGLEAPLDISSGLFHTFEGDKSLDSVIFPQAFSGYRLGNLDYSFDGCSSIVEIDLSKFDFSSVYVISGAFHNCSSLRRIIDVEKICSSKTYRFERCFEGCSSLESLDLSGWDTSSVVAYDKRDNHAAVVTCPSAALFAGCIKLRVLKLGKLFAFYCNHGNDIANSVYPPAPSSEYIDGADGYWYAESDGTKYNPVDIPSEKADTYYAVKPMAFAVYSSDDESLNYYRRAGRPVVGDTWGGKNIDGVYSDFEDKAYRTTSSTNNDIETMTTPWADIHNDVKSVSVIDDGIKPISIAYWFQFFRNCISFDLNKLDLSNCTSIQHTFAYCYAAADMKVNEWNTSKIENLDSTFKYMFAIESIDLSGWYTSSCNNMHEMFMNDYKLSKIVLGCSWHTSHVTDFVEMFLACSQLVLDCSKWDVSNTNYQQFTDPAQLGKRGNSAFCDGAHGVIKPEPWQETTFAIYSSDDNSLDFYKRERRLIPTNGSTFNDKTVSSVYTGIDETVYSLDYSGNYSDWTTDCPWFDVRKSIKSVHVVDSIKPVSIGLWFFQFMNCSYVDVSNIDTSRCVSMYYTFSSLGGHGDLTLIGLDKWDTSNVKRLDAVFNGVQLREIPGISNWDTSSVTSFVDAFYNCFALERLDISGWSDESISSNQPLLDSDNTSRYVNIKSIRIGKKWTHPMNIFANSVVMQIPLEDGKWYSLSDGSSYSPADIPAGRNDTYYVSKELRDEAASAA